MNVCWCSCIIVDSCHRAGGDFGCQALSLLDLFCRKPRRPSLINRPSSLHLQAFAFCLSRCFFHFLPISTTSPRLSSSSQLLRSKLSSVKDQREERTLPFVRCFSVSELWLNSNCVEWHCLSFILVLPAALWDFHCEQINFDWWIEVLSWDAMKSNQVEQQREWRLETSGRTPCPRRTVFASEQTGWHFISGVSHADIKKAACVQPLRTAGRWHTRRHFGQRLWEVGDAQRDSRLVSPLPGGTLTPSCCPPCVIHSQSQQRRLK